MIYTKAFSVSLSDIQRVFSERLMSGKNILFIGAHPDDIELGCGATMIKEIDNGNRVASIVLSRGLAGGAETRMVETCSALSLLGCRRVFCLDFDDTRLDFCLDKIILAIEDIIDKHISPSGGLHRVYTMQKDDRHQDHRTVYYASIVACRGARDILCYEVPSSLEYAVPQVYSIVDEKCLERKIMALQLHTSQSHRPYMQPEQIKVMAQFRGQMAGNYQYAEAFFIHKMVLQA
jgi:LmbE family N-acetylglucosaminyl deacetylase